MYVRYWHGYTAWFLSLTTPVNQNILSHLPRCKYETIVIPFLVHVFNFKVLSFKHRMITSLAVVKMGGKHPLPSLPSIVASGWFMAAPTVPATLTSFFLPQGFVCDHVTRPEMVARTEPHLNCLIYDGLKTIDKIKADVWCRLYGPKRCEEIRCRTETKRGTIITLTADSTKARAKKCSAGEGPTFISSRKCRKTLLLHPSRSIHHSSPPHYFPARGIGFSWSPWFFSHSLSRNQSVVCGVNQITRYLSVDAIEGTTIAERETLHFCLVS